MSSASRGGGRFQAGGAVRRDNAYVRRDADDELPQTLMAGEFCYVLAPRQMGKTSLKVRTIDHLAEEGVRSVDVDLTVLGSRVEAAETWYLGLLDEIADQLGLDADLDDFWEGNRRLSEVHRWSRFLRDVLLAEVEERVVIFIDEIDSVLALPFSSDDFFASIRATYNQRAAEPAWERLTFCLLGVAAPQELIEDPQRTPFNIGVPIALRDFTATEARALVPELAGVSDQPEMLFEKVLEWTDGHPYMTQKVCERLWQRREQTGAPMQRVEEVVGEAFLRPGTALEVNLQTAKDRLLRAGVATPGMMALYRRVWSGEKIAVDERNRVQQALMLTGMVAEQEAGERTSLAVRNRIFAEVFDLEWVQEKEAHRPFSEALTRWLESRRREDFVLRGRALEEYRAWATEREDLTAEEQGFLLAGVEVEERARRKELRRSRWIMALLAAASSIILAFGTYALLQRTRAEQARSEAVDEREVAVEAKIEAERLRAIAESEELRADIAAEEAYDSAQEARRRAVAEQRQREAADQARSLAERSTRVAEAERQRAEKARLAEAETRQEMQKKLVLADLRVGTSALASTRPGEGLAFLAHAVRTDESSVAARSAVFQALRYRQWPRLAGILRHEERVWDTSFSPDGSRLLTGSADGTARLWNAKTLQPMGEPLRHGTLVLSASFSPGGRRLFTGSADGTARLWNASTLQPVGEPLRHGALVLSASFSPDGSRLFTGSSDGTARLWDASTRQPVGEPLRHEAGVRSASFSPDGSQLLTGSDDGTARLWDAASLQLVGEPLQHEAPVRSASFSPDGSRLFTGSDDGTAWFWDVASFQPVGEPLRHGARVLSASFSPDGSRLFTGSADGTARLWDASTLQPAGEPLQHEANVRFASFSPDGSRLLTGSDDGTVRLWDASTLQPVGKPLQHGARVLFASFSPDGTRLFTGSNDGTAQLRDASTLQPVGKLLRHEVGVLSASFSPDGSRLLNGLYDGTAQFSDASTLQPMGEPLRHEAGVLHASFNPDGTRMLTVSHEGAARLWAVPKGANTDAPALIDLAETVAGYKIDQLTNPVPIPPEDTLNHLADLRRRASDAPTDSETWNFIRWYLDDPWTRTVSHSLTVTVPEYIERVLAEGDKKAREELFRTYRGHPLLRGKTP